MANLFILGAGFSRAANFPLGVELFKETIELAKIRGLYSTVLKPDIDKFLTYLSDTCNSRIEESDIHFEEFISYLDIEHYLWLEGSDTFTREGNKSQLVIRNLIGLVLYLRLQEISDNDLDIYREFARRLEPGDLLISFNYDTLLEVVFDELDIPYRLFPTRFSSVNQLSGTVKYPEEEVILLKMHGSIDWFDKTSYLESKKTLEIQGIDKLPRHPIFNNPEKISPKRLIDCPYFENNPLMNVYRVRNIGTYYTEASFLLESPLLISPSYNKIIYLNPLKSFWHGFNRVGNGFTRMSVIGFSLPQHDEYIRQPLYHLISNFQFSNETPLGTKKSKLVMLDFRKDQTEIDCYRRSYNFVNWDKTTEYYNGFCEESLDLLFE